ncbi:hypothetical protein ABEX25_27240 [Paenibacillus thiaminolyticus]|uniref:hypothetical protein n=1 Tax=Paenibacillus thiaminolyticus TaxID=49283 RepID=UPI003D26F104
MQALRQMPLAGAQVERCWASGLPGGSAPSARPLLQNYSNLLLWEADLVKKLHWCSFLTFFIPFGAKVVEIPADLQESKSGS